MINEKYENIYNKALNATQPELNNDVLMQKGDKYVPATPIGYDDEQLAFDALHDVIETAFTKDKDYVCWSNGGYTKKTENILETLEGCVLKKYDPVLLLGNFGEPLGFMMYTGECEEEEDYIRPTFLYINVDTDRVMKYRPKVFNKLKFTSKEPNEL